jgi:hypothetical protein
VKELHAKGEAAFVAEVGDKARVRWNESGYSEAAKMKSAWFEAARKRAAAGGAPGQPAAKRLPPALVVVQPLALAVVLKTALSCTSEAPCERDLTIRAPKTHITTERTENRRTRLFFLLAYRHRPLADIMRPGCFWVLS